MAEDQVDDAGTDEAPDYTYIKSLFDVIAACDKYPGKFGNIKTAAFDELEQINRDWEPEKA